MAPPISAKSSAVRGRAETALPAADGAATPAGAGVLPGAGQLPAMSKPTRTPAFAPAATSTASMRAARRRAGPTAARARASACTVPGGTGAAGVVRARQGPRGRTRSPCRPRAAGRPVTSSARPSWSDCGRGLGLGQRALSAPRRRLQCRRRAPRRTERAGMSSAKSPPLGDADVPHQPVGAQLHAQRVARVTGRYLGPSPAAAAADLRSRGSSAGPIGRRLGVGQSISPPVLKPAGSVRPAWSAGRSRPGSSSRCASAAGARRQASHSGWPGSTPCGACATSSARTCSVLITARKRRARQPRSAGSRAGRRAGRAADAWALDRWRNELRLSIRGRQA